MKKILILFAIIILLSGGTTVVKSERNIAPQSSVVDHLDAIAIKMDSTSTKLNYSSTALKNLQ